MGVGLTILVIFLCIAAEAFFSGSEIGVVSADRMRLRHEAAQGSRGARLALQMLEKPEWLLSTTLVGTNISVVTTTTLTTGLVVELFGEGYSWLAIVVAAPLVWVFGEIVAKSVFQQRADTLTPRIIFALRAASYVFMPILLVFSGLTRFLARLVGGDAETRNPFMLREEIASMVEMSATEEGDILPIERAMIRRVFDFSETTARDILVPLIDVTAIDRRATAGLARSVAAAAGHERLPVYEGRVDRVVGLLDALKLLGVDDATPIEAHIRPVPYVPGSKSIEALLGELRAGRHQMVVIVDEFGGAEGILTVEDIVEQVVGEIEDEFDDQPQQWIRRVGERECLMSARVELDTVQEELGIHLPDGKYETVGGFLMEIVRDIPQPGAEIRWRQLHFTVEKASAVTVHEVRLRW